MSKESAGLFTLLAGKLKFANTGPRPSEDALWLAAATPTTLQGAYLELGTGCGAVAFALLSRIESAKLQGVELEKDLVALASQNAFLNNMAARFQAQQGDALTLTLPNTFHHSLANPPFHNVEAGFYSTHKQVAHGISKHALKNWVETMHTHTQPGGTCTIIVHVDMLASLPPAAAYFFLESRPASPPKRVIIQWIVGELTSAPATYLVPTHAAHLRRLVLEQGQPLPLAELVQNMPQPQAS